MNVYGFKFKRVLEDAVHLAGRRLGEFRKEYHVDDFFADALGDDDGAAGIGVKALYQLCRADNGGFNGCTICLKAVLVFLHAEARESPQLESDCQACLKDLSRVLADPTSTTDTIAAWINRWFAF